MPKSDNDNGADKLYPTSLNLCLIYKLAIAVQRQNLIRYLMTHHTQLFPHITGDSRSIKIHKCK